MLDNEDKTELIESFYKDLEFGTGGLRGIMGAGTNRMNIYTVGAATQGLANYLKTAFANLSEIKVVVGHDVRNNSRLFAETVANIFPQMELKFTCSILAAQLLKCRLPSAILDAKAV